MKNILKPVSVALWLLSASFLRGADCETETLKGLSGSTNLIILHLEPGVTNKVTWDFTGCWFNISQFAITIEKPNKVKASSIQCHAVNVTTGNVAPEYPNYLGRFLGDVGFSFLELELVLDPDAKKPVDVQVIYTAGFGG